jgi:hypothetical protein
MIRTTVRKTSERGKYHIYNSASQYDSSKGVQAFCSRWLGRPESEFHTDNREDLEQFLNDLEPGDQLCKQCTLSQDLR